MINDKTLGVVSGDKKSCVMLMKRAPYIAKIQLMMLLVGFTYLPQIIHLEISKLSLTYYIVIFSIVKNMIKYYRHQNQPPRL